MRYPTLLSVLATLFSGCTYIADDELQCEEGKCDGIAGLKSLMRDPKDLDLGDLVAIGSKFATEQLNDTLKVSDFASIRLGEPRFFGLRNATDPDLTLENLEDLVSGLAARYGERELSTEVNAVRTRHLSSSSDKVYVESAFRIGVNAGWNESVGGLGDATVTVGFGAGANLEARTISAHKSELSSVGRAPLAAMAAARGFVFPRSLDDVRAMKPGESFALLGDGSLGVNLGVGVPILVANPGPAITYSIVLSAGLRARIAGQLDVQLVRLDDNSVVVDVGMQKVREKSAKIALDDAWGVQGLLETSVSMGGISVDLGKLVDKALQKQLASKLHLFSAELSASETVQRVSVARMRFSLDGDAAVVGPALAQALRGDVRLAQALANRGERGVTADFDLLRSGSSSVSFAGIDLFGMSFFKQSIASQGQVIVQTPGGVRTLMFDSLRKQSGSFFSEHGYTRVGLSGLNFDPSDPKETRGEANLFVQLQEADLFMERDKMLDHVDALILALTGGNGLAEIETAGNELERFVERTCPNSQAFDPCRTSVLTNPTATALRAQGVDAARSAGSALTTSQRALLEKLAAFRMTAQITYEPKASLVGPDSTWTIDYRIDDAGLTQLMTERSPADFKAALDRYAKAVAIRRIDSPTAIASSRTQLEGELRATIDELAKIYEADQAAYERFASIERAAVSSLGRLGPRVLEIRVPVDASKRPQYEAAAASSFAEARSRVVTHLFDALAAKTTRFGKPVEQATGYALLSLLDASLLDLRVDAKMDLSDGAAQSLSHYRAAGYAPFDVIGKGESVAPIDGGLFSIDALLAGQ